MSRKSLILVGLMILSLLSAPPLFARGGLTLDQAVKQAREQTGGRVISTETKEKNGQIYYNIRILTNDGKVRRLRYEGGGDSRNNDRR